MAGLLAAQYFRSHGPLVMERQESLPNNHKALLRFKSEAVSDLTGIRFKKVNVQKLINYKEVHYHKGSVLLNNLYSLKVTGGVHQRSLMNTEDATRFIAPEDFIDRVSKGTTFHFCQDADRHVKNQMSDSSTPMISTVPITDLAKMLDWDFKQELQTREIWTFTFTLGMDIDVYQTCYYPNPRLPLYRLSITGGKVIAEFCRNPINETAWCDETFKNIYHFLEIDFGVNRMDYSIDELEQTHQEHGKIVPCDRGEIQEFMGWASREYNIYSLGRWGTHRQILMDDVVHDLKVIGNLIESKGYRR